MNSFFEIPTAVAEFYIDSSLRALKAFNLASEQGEEITRRMLDNGKAVREESIKFAHRWAELARENQRQLVQTVNHTVKLGMDNYRSASQHTIEEMNRQAQRFTQRAEAAAPAPAKAAKG